MASPTALVSVKAAVTRGLIGSERKLLRSEPVAGAAHGFQRAAPEGVVDLRAQPADVDLDHVRMTLVGGIPGVFEQEVAAQYTAGPAHQRLEQDELFARERDR